MSSKYLRSYLLAGLVAWLPILVTFGILRFIIELLDNTIALLPKAYQPEQLFGRSIPGLGVVLSLAILFVTGIVATNFLGQRLMRLGEKLLVKIPLVRSLYKTSKQMINAVFASNGQAFRKVVLVEYPRKGIWSVAFLTSTTQPTFFNGEAEDILSVFIPTTPNPTSGFLMMVSKRETKEIDMSVEDALKFIISLGVTTQSPLADSAKTI